MSASKGTTRHDRIKKTIDKARQGAREVGADAGRAGRHAEEDAKSVGRTAKHAIEDVIAESGIDRK